MLTLPSQRIHAYCETFLPLPAGKPQYAQLLLHLLFERGIIRRDAFFLYQHAGSETRIAADPFAWIVVDVESTTLGMPGNKQALKETTSADPLKQVERLLSEMPVRVATAYGYITFDLAYRYFHVDKTKALSSPLLHFMVPKVELRVTDEGVVIRSIEAHIMQDLVNACEDTIRLDRPALPEAEKLDIYTEDRAWYEEAVRRVVAAIHEDAHCQGPFQKAILARAVRVEGPLDLLGTYALVQRDPAARSYCFQLDGNAAVGASPETLLQVDRDGWMSTNPLAGTRWRGETPYEDSRLDSQLQISRKQQMEHLISVVAVQREMETVCRQETICVRGLAHVQKYRTVQHLASCLTGQLAAGNTAWDALRAVFPGITVSGIDKASALSWINELEQTPRGMYAGAIGWVSNDGFADLAIAIRTIFQEGGHVRFSSGAGIVADSDPADEYEETWHKMQAVWPYFVRGNTHR